jgi:hypothetical protein
MNNYIISNSVEETPKKYKYKLAFLSTINKNICIVLFVNHQSKKS